MVKKLSTISNTTIGKIAFNKGACLEKEEHSINHAKIGYSHKLCIMQVIKSEMPVSSKVVT